MFHMFKMQLWINNRKQQQLNKESKESTEPVQ